MSASGGDRYRIVLGKAEETSFNDVTSRFCDLFDVNPALGRQIVQSAPIVILSDLTRQQAMELVQILAPLRKAGAGVRVEISDDKSVSQVAWPAPPQVAGKPLAAYDAADPKDNELLFLCPECGKRLILDVKSAAAEAETKKPKPPPARTPPPAASGTKVKTAVSDTPEASDEDDLFSDLAPSLITPGTDHMVDPLDEFETGLNEALDQNTNASPNGTKLAMDIPRDSAEPEEGTKRASTRRKAKGGTEIADAPPSYDSGPFNVLLPKTGNPAAAIVLALTMGIDEEEAEQKVRQQVAPIPVAKGISKEAARDIGQRFKKHGISVRITRRR